MDYGIFQVIETSPNICQYPIPIDPLHPCIKIQLQLSYCFSSWIFNTINVYRDGGWEKIPKEPFGSVFGLGCLLQLAGCWLEYDVGSLAGCRVLGGI